MTPALLATLRAAGEAATPGVWKVADSHGLCIRVEGSMVADMSPGSTSPSWEGRREDAAFIALARNHWGELLDEIERLKARHASIASESYAAGHLAATEQAEARHAAVAEERDRLRAALRRYGHHDSYDSGSLCPRYEDNGGPAGDGPCTCGFSAALDGEEVPRG